MITAIAIPYLPWRLQRARRDRRNFGGLLRLENPLQVEDLHFFNA